MSHNNAEIQQLHHNASIINRGIYNNRNLVKKNITIEMGNLSMN